jgi:hypothetical protein
MWKEAEIHLVKIQQVDIFAARMRETVKSPQLEVLSAFDFQLST